MSFLKKTGFDMCLKEYIQKGGNYLGICIGMQVLHEI
jgi:imidazoleglycerol phosphate synthase glutamine amidotransferase subunit HisH